MGRLFLVFIILAWIAWTIYREVIYHKLKRTMDGLKEPELWLSRRERRAHARELLQRERDEYTQNLVEETMRKLQKGEQI